MKTSISKQKKMMNKRKKDLIFYCCLVAIPTVHFIVFYIYVNFNSILLAFKDYDTGGNFKWVGLSNFTAVISSFSQYTVYGVAFKNTMIVFGVGTIIGMTLGILFSFYIYKKAPFKNLFKVLLFMPSIIPAIAMATVFKQFVDSAIPSLFEKAFGVAIQGFIQNPSSTLGTIIFYNIWMSFGVAVLLYLGAMNNISESVVEAAKLDGAGFFKEFIFITMPNIFSTISVFLIVAIGSMFVNQASIYSFFGNAADESIFTIGYYLYKETIKNSLGGTSAGYPFLSAFGILLTFVSIALVFGTNYLIKRFGPSTER